MLCSKVKFLFNLFISMVICLFQFRFSSIHSPRNLVYSLLFIHSPISICLSLSFVSPKDMNTVLVMFNVNLLALNQSEIFDRSDSRPYLR